MRKDGNRWIDDVKEWTGLNQNDMWMESEDCEAYTKRVTLSPQHAE